ncbi:MAG: hypothetical protein ACETWB_07340 [Anaerolineae bacterium]
MLWVQAKEITTVPIGAFRIETAEGVEWPDFSITDAATGELLEPNVWWKEASYVVAPGRYHLGFGAGPVEVTVQAGQENMVSLK